MSQESASGLEEDAFGELAALLLALLAKEVGPNKFAELGIRAASVAGTFELEDGIYSVDMKPRNEEIQKRMATCLSTVLASREMLDSVMITTEDGKAINLDELSWRVSESIVGSSILPDAETWQGLQDNVADILGYKSWTDMLVEIAHEGR